MTQTLTVFLLLLMSRRLSVTAKINDCDPQIPSRPQPAPPGHGVQMALSHTEPTVCKEGEYFDRFTCRSCDDGTFMTRKMAEEGEHVTCVRCYQPELAEIVAEPCTRTRDAKIMCEDGYFRFEDPEERCRSECRLCDTCGVGVYMFHNFVGLECGGYQNTVCCPTDSMVVINGSCVRKGTVPTTAAPTTPSTPTTQTTFTTQTVMAYDHLHNGDGHQGSKGSNITKYLPSLALYLLYYKAVYHTLL
ncbi:unnamed protein product [Lymnaea stagnalis]|uniref:TNFR-Cys domain-containing protein n=1 Tax=Lymnaea stagnalis TaxID=6523 RepID=A0AAV2HTF0_LYMST